MSSQAKPIGLKRTILFSSVGISTLISILLISAIAYFQFKSAKQSFQNRAAVVQRLFQENISQDFLLGQNQAVYTRCKSLVSEPSIEEISVVRNNGEVVCDLKNGNSNLEQLSTSAPLLFGSNADVAGTIKIAFSTSDLHEQLISLFLITVGSLAFCLIAQFFAFRYLNRVLLDPIESLSSLLGSKDLTRIRDEKSLPESTSVKEIRTLIVASQEMAGANLELQKISIESEKQKAVALVASQVSHDIRSPLAALNTVVAGLATLPQEKRHLIRNAVQRINDIANQLLKTGKTESEEGDQGPVMLSYLLENIISEKRVQYRDRLDVEIRGELQGGFGLFASLNPSGLSRAISNFINNAVEAADGYLSARIFLSNENGQARIEISDNGKGISAEMLAKIGELGASEGKGSSEDSGSGLGIFTAKQFVNEAGGAFEVKSILGQGTKIIISFPLVSPPAWFAKEIVVPAGAEIIAVDDDQSVHQVWSSRFDEKFLAEAGATFRSFTNESAINDYLAKSPKRDRIFLVDFEFEGQARNGLDIIRDKRLGGPAMLVTSRSDEPEVLSEVAEMGIKMLPKGLAALVPIRKKAEATSLAAVVIDDDVLIHQIWNLSAKKRGVQVKCFKDYASFAEAQDSIAKDSPIFIDVNLAKDERGERVAEQVAALGFTDLSLATGYNASTIVAPKCVKRVVGKEPIFD